MGPDFYPALQLTIRALFKKKNQLLSHYQKSQYSRALSLEQDSEQLLNHILHVRRNLTLINAEYRLWDEFLPVTWDHKCVFVPLTACSDIRMYVPTLFYFFPALYFKKTEIIIMIMKSGSRYRIIQCERQRTWKIFELKQGCVYWIKPNVPSDFLLKKSSDFDSRMNQDWKSNIHRIIKVEKDPQDHWATIEHTYEGRIMWGNIVWGMIKKKKKKSHEVIYIDSRLNFVD